VFGDVVRVSSFRQSDRISETQTNREAGLPDADSLACGDRVPSQRGCVDEGFLGHMHGVDRGVEQGHQNASLRCHRRERGELAVELPSVETEVDGEVFVGNAGRPLAGADLGRRARTVTCRRRYRPPQVIVRGDRNASFLTDAAVRVVDGAGTQRRRWLTPDPPRSLSGEGLTIRGKGALSWENSGCETCN